MTEFSCPDFSGGGGTVEANLAFVRDALPGIARVAPTLERYAWFATRTYSNGGSETGYRNTTQFRADGTLTAVGRAYAELRP